MTIREEFRYVRRVVSLREGADIPKRGEPARDIWRIIELLAVVAQHPEERPIMGTKGERWYVLLVEEDLGP